MDERRFTSEPYPAIGFRAKAILALQDAPPTDYKIKIQSFTELSSIVREKYESAIFEASGYKWRLILYPKGNAQQNGAGFISLYLAMAETEHLRLGWDVNVIFKMFVFDHNLDKYLTIQDGDGRVRRLHDMKTGCGFDQLLPPSVFEDPSNGYLVADSYVFGVEVFVAKYNGRGESVSILKDPPDGTYIWKIDNFASQCQQDSLYSDLFTVGGHNWRLWVYPKGHIGSGARDKYFTVCLISDDNEGFPGPSSVLYMEGTVVIKSQANADHHISREFEAWFGKGTCGIGYHEFVSLTDLNDESKGYLVNDSIVVECRVSVMSVVKYSV